MSRAEDTVGTIGAAIADAGVVERDPRLVGLGLLLDDDALSSLVGERVRVSRLRYKPGRSVVAAWSSVDGDARGWVGSYVAPEKVDKAVTAAGRVGAPATVSADGSTVAVGAIGDRALVRIIGRLQRRHPLLLENGVLVRHNPMRRQVWRTHDGDGRDVALRIHAGAGSDVAAIRALASMGLPVLVPEPVVGLAGAELVPWWGDGDLAGIPRRESAHDAGVTAARLHATAAAGRTTSRSGAEGSLTAVDVILPGLHDRVHDLLRALPDTLPGSALVPLHGDLSPDQVLVGDDGIRLIDFDRRQVGPRERDLGSFLAAAELLGLDELREPFLDGYARAGGRWDEHALSVWEGVCLLERAADPFRDRVDDWPGRTRHVLDRAATRLGR